MTDKQKTEFGKIVLQLFKENQDNIKEAYLSSTSPDFFINDTSSYSIPRANNHAQFLYTGEDYFNEVAKAIDSAEKTIYLTGWQINYDVLLKTPEAKSKKKEIEKLEEELREVEDVIGKIHMATKPQLDNLIKELESINRIEDSVKIVQKANQELTRIIEAEYTIEQIQQQIQTIVDNVLPPEEAPKPPRNQANIDDEDLEAQAIQEDKYQQKITDITEQTDPLTGKKTQQNPMPTRKELKEGVAKIVKALKVEERVKEILTAANTGVKDSLWTHLRDAVKRGVNVYVMPWSCPPVGPVQTFDLDTMLAVFQLNAGLEEQRAFFMFSTLDSDMGKLAGLFFSHHQKSVIVDHKVGFVGGMDLAYGRRDDKSFNLDASVRFGNDRYNPCIPPMQQALRSTHVSRMALAMSTLFNISETSTALNQGFAVTDIDTTFKNWWNTPASWSQINDIRKEIQPIVDNRDRIVKDFKKQAVDEVVDPIISYYTTDMIDQIADYISIFYIAYRVERSIANNYVYRPISNKIAFDVSLKHINKVYNTGVPDKVLGRYSQPVAISTYTNIYYPRLAATKNLYRYLRGDKFVALQKIIELREENKSVPIPYYTLALTEIRTLLKDTPPGQLFSQFMDVGLDADDPNGNSLGADLGNIGYLALWSAFTLFQDRATKLKAPYCYLEPTLQPLMPAGGITLNDGSQPRMPWHDITVKVSGPSVHDIARNFIDRWNASQMLAAQDSKPLKDNKSFMALMLWAKQQISQSPIDKNNLDEKTLKQIKALGEELLNAQYKPTYIDPKTLPQAADIKAKGDGEEALVQIIRSAPIAMLKREKDTQQKIDQIFSKVMLNDAQSEGDADQPQALNLSQYSAEQLIHKIKENLLQQDSQKAWIQCIKGAQYFLHIETQFFQSAYGVDQGYRAKNEAGEKVTSGPMSVAEMVEANPDFEKYKFKEALTQVDITVIDWQALKELAQKRPSHFYKIMGDFYREWMARIQKRLLQELFAGKDVGENDPKERNLIAEAIADRIELAVREEADFHVYLVMPVHPEGKLGDATVMHTVHLAMQTIVNGENSLLKRIQRAICIHYLMKDGLSYQQAKQRAEQRQEDGAPLFTKPQLAGRKNWQDYLTLLNLRTWDRFSNRGMTEQIYVHSKMLIADDRVAIVGSANANDRSMEGDRDSEIGAIVKGKSDVQIEIFGNGDQYKVSKLVHEFRKGLWSKLFAVDAKDVPVDPAFTGAELEQILNQPAAPKTWQAIQQVANKNAELYNAKFNFIPQNISPVQDPKQVDQGPYPIPSKNYYPLGCSIWPTWSYNYPDQHWRGGKLKAPLPFQEEFWAVNTYMRYGIPDTIKGFIVALPIQWTQGENNTSGFHHYIIS